MTGDDDVVIWGIFFASWTFGQFWLYKKKVEGLDRVLSLHFFMVGLEVDVVSPQMGELREHVFLPWKFYRSNM